VLSNVLWSPARRTRHFVGHGGSVALGDVLACYGILEVEGKVRGRRKCVLSLTAQKC
jgi:hypothetical protein